MAENISTQTTAATAGAMIQPIIQVPNFAAPFALPPTQDELPYEGDGNPELPEPIVRLPTQDELPYDDGEPMESERHRLQMNLLIESLRVDWKDRQDFFSGGNMFVYFSPAQIKSNDFRGPDVFVALGVDRKRERKSWVAWEEGKCPDVVIELLSETTADFDRTEKKYIYQDKMKVTEYYWFDPDSLEWAGFIRRNGLYEPIPLTAGDRLISPTLNLALAQREGLFNDYEGIWLRWETLDGKLLRSYEEVAKEQQARAERMDAKLRELGVDPDAVP